MKLTRVTVLLVLALALGFSVGCKKKPVGVTRIPTPPRAGVSDPGATQPLQPDFGLEGTESGIPLGDPGAHAGWPENAEIFKPFTVHFAFDSSVVRSSDKSKVAAVADHLKANPSHAVRIEGHCDERGTEEYNRALGERRALAVREELAKSGINPTRVDTVSYGEDRPVNPAHDEEAWSQNRRAEFILLTPPQ